MRGFTFFDMLMVLLVLLIVGIVAIPDALTRLAVREDVRAIRQLQWVAVQEAQLLATRGLDRDSDGRAEYGFLSDLPRRLASEGEAPRGAVRIGGFYIAVLLPDAQGRPIGPDRAADVNPDLAEQGFLAVAWPVEAERTGVRVFVSDPGLLVAENLNENGQFSGHRFPIDELPRIAVKGPAGLRARDAWPPDWVLPAPPAQRDRIRKLLREARLPVPGDWPPPKDD